MFAWLSRMFRRTPLGIYSPKERKIFSYFDGKKLVSGDPMEIYKKLMMVFPDLKANLQISESVLAKPEITIKASDDAIATLRGIFGVAPLPEGGLTQSEVLDLFDGFVMYVLELKKNSPQFPTLPEGPSPPMQPSPVPNPPTPSSSGSGSAASGPPTDGQPGLPKGSE